MLGLPLVPFFELIGLAALEDLITEHNLFVVAIVKVEIACGICQLKCTHLIVHNVVRDGQELWHIASTFGYLLTCQFLLDHLGLLLNG